MSFTLIVQLYSLTLYRLTLIVFYEVAIATQFFILVSSIVLTSSTTITILTSDTTTMISTSDTTITILTSDTTTTIASAR